MLHIKITFINVNFGFMAHYVVLFRKAVANLFYESIFSNLQKFLESNITVLVSMGNY